MFQEKDYLHRMVGQLADALRGVLKLRAERRLDEALQALAETHEAQFVLPAAALDALDAGSVKRLLGDPSRLDAYLQVTALRAELLDERGDAPAAARLRSRVAALRSAPPAGG